MSTIKSSAENLTLNADGSGNDISMQSNAAEKLKLTAEGNLHLQGSDSRIQLNAQGGANVVGNNTVHIRGDGTSMKLMTASGGDYIYEVNGSEKMRIKAEGNVLVGTTSTTVGGATSGSGFRIDGANGILQVAASQSISAIFNRTSTDGSIVSLRKNGSEIGSIGTAGGSLHLGGGDCGIGFYQGADAWVPVNGTTFAIRDNAIDLGYSSARFDDIWATNGTIQTSDRNEKQDIEELSVAETAVATACKGLMRKFRWKSAVAEKGDDARIHFGIIAQDLQDAFTAEGLDAGDYAMFISSTWYEKLVPVDAVIGVEAVEATYDDEGTELTPAVEAVEAKDSYTRTDIEDAPTEGYTEKTRLGVRYPELLAFIISAI